MKVISNISRLRDISEKGSPKVKVFGMELTAIPELTGSALFQKTSLLLLSVFYLSSASLTAVASEEWLMKNAVVAAVERDAIIQKLNVKAHAAKNLSVSTNQLPDPVIKLSARNFPVDTFDIDQEPMTQVAIGVAQMFPAGESLEIRRDVQLKKESQFNHLSSGREMLIAERTRMGWLEVYYWHKAVEILHKDEALFNHLLRITQSMYSVGRKQQHDVIRAELEIGKLKERIIVAKRNVRLHQQKLARWTGEKALNSVWPTAIEKIESNGYEHHDNRALVSSLKRHPNLQALDNETERKQLETALTEQGYKPKWGVEVTYAHRDGEGGDGASRPDFFSAMLNFQLPLFEAKRQDSALSASRYELEAQRYHYIDALREQTAAFMAERNRWLEMRERIDLYNNQLLSQSSQQAKATLTAYESDTTDFSELMRAYLNDQRVLLDFHRLVVNEQKQLAKLDYLIGASLDEPFAGPGE